MIQFNNPTQVANWLKINVTGTLTIDSRDIQPGDGFIAWPGAVEDGRKYVKSALQKGAVVCLVEDADLELKGFSKEYNNDEHNSKIASYKNLKSAIGSIAAQAYNTPAKSLNIIAITGTNGKTTTAWWLSQALSSVISNASNAVEKENKCFMVGTLGIGVPPIDGPIAKTIAKTITKTISQKEIEKNIQFTGLTTPDPITLHKKFREYVDLGFKYCAIEASSIGIDEHRLDGTDIKVAVFTNFTQDHLDYHGSMQAYWEAKYKLFQWPSLKAAVINIDDPKGRELNELLKESKFDIWTFGINQSARLTAHNIKQGIAGVQFDIAEGEETYVIETHFFGEYNVLNILGVIAAMRANGFALADCVQGCQSLTAVPGRMDVLVKEALPLVVIDFAHTPDALKQALIALRPAADKRSGKLICIFGCGGNRDAAKRPLMAAMAEAFADGVVVTSDNSRNEKTELILDNIIAGFKSEAKVTVEANRATAITKSIQAANASDVILIAGKGHENYQEVMGVKTYFSDKEEAWNAMMAKEAVVC